MNKDHFLRPIENRLAPPWPCPKCRAGTLHVDASTIKFHETPSSLELRRDGYEETPTEICTLLLRCSNKACSEFFRLVGDRTYEQVEAETGEFYWSPTTTPLFIHPGLEFFVPPPRCPEAVRKELASACYLYWADPAAAGNKLRIAAENLLTELKIKRSEFRTVKNKRIRWNLTLNDRIKLLKGRFEEIKANLHALRHLGNEGSHAGLLTHADLLEDVEILEQVLDKVYVGTEKRISSRIKEINTRRGSRKKKPRPSRRLFP